MKVKRVMKRDAPAVLKPSVISCGAVCCNALKCSQVCVAVSAVGKMQVVAKLKLAHHVVSSFLNYICQHVLCQRALSTLW